MSNVNKNPNYSLWFYALLVYHWIAWTIVPAIVRMALPIDSMESTTWARNLDWGYDKNPYLNAWVTELAIKMGGQHDWIIYAFSQLAIIITFYALWRLGKLILSPLYATVAVFILEGVQYFNFSGIELNDNLLELPLWSLIMLMFYYAVKQQKLVQWLVVGLLAGLAAMDKYFAAMLFIPMFLFLLSNHEGRRSFSNVGLYLSVLVALIIIAPHIYWLTQHDFITLQYAFRRVGHPDSFWQRHILGPLDFGFTQIITFAPALLLFASLWLGKAKGPLLSEKKSISQFDRQFLIWIGLGPFITTVLLAIIAGFKLHVMWGTPLVISWSLVLLMLVQPTVHLSQWRKFVSITFVYLTLTWIAFAIVNSLPGATKSNYPAKNISENITKYWHEHYNAPLSYVAGQRYVAGGVSFYSVDRPAVYIDWNKAFSPWINEADLQEKGAVFILPVDKDHPDFPAEVKQRFPNLIFLPIMSYAWERSPRQLPLQIRVAILPPKNLN